MCYFQNGKLNQKNGVRERTHECGRVYKAYNLNIHGRSILGKNRVAKPETLYYRLKEKNLPKNLGHLRVKLTNDEGT